MSISNHKKIINDCNYNFNYDFIKMGSHDISVQENEFCLDTGNQLTKGIVDHHHLNRPISAAGLIYEKPNLILENIDSNINDIKIILHKEPDLDCVASAYFAKMLICEGEFKPETSFLAKYVSRIDQGEIIPPDPDYPELYFIFVFLADQIQSEIHNINYDEDLSESEQNKLINKQYMKILNMGFKLLDHYFIAAKENKGMDQDIFKSIYVNIPEYKSIKNLIREDYRKYESDLANERKVKILDLKLPHKRTKTIIRTEGLFYRNPTAKHFKLWARNDKKNSPNDEGFCFLHVIWQDNSADNKRHVISVDPYKNVNLAGLGNALNIYEMRCFTDSELKSQKPRYDQWPLNDPWYDGRNHDYTIVDTPRDGTKLSEDEVKSIVSSFNAINALQKLELTDNSFFQAMFEGYTDFISPEQLRSVKTTLQKDGWRDLIQSNINKKTKHDFHISEANLVPDFESTLFELNQTKFFLLSKTYPKSDFVQVKILMNTLGVILVFIDINICHFSIEKLLELNRVCNTKVSFQKFFAHYNAILENSSSTKNPSNNVAEKISNTTKIIEDCQNFFNLIEIEDILLFSIYNFLEIDKLDLIRDQEFFNKLIDNYSVGEDDISDQIQDTDDIISVNEFVKLVIMKNRFIVFSDRAKVKSVDQDYEDFKKSLKGSFWYIYLHNIIQKTYIKKLISGINTLSEYMDKLTSTKLKHLNKHYIFLKTQFINDDITNSIIENKVNTKISNQFSLDNYKSLINDSLDNLSNYFQSLRQSKIDKILFYITILVGPLTMLGDYIGGLLGGFDSLPNIFVIIAVTYSLAVLLFVGIKKALKVYDKRRTNQLYLKNIPSENDKKK